MLERKLEQVMGQERALASREAAQIGDPNPAGGSWQKWEGHSQGTQQAREARLSLALQRGREEAVGCREGSRMKIIVTGGAGLCRPSWWPRRGLLWALWDLS